MIEFATETDSETAMINELFSAESMNEYCREISGVLPFDLLPMSNTLPCGHIVVPVPENKEQQLSFFGDKV